MTQLSLTSLIIVTSAQQISVSLVYLFFPIILLFDVNASWTLTII